MPKIVVHGLLLLGLFATDVCVATILYQDGRLGSHALCFLLGFWYLLLFRMIIAALSLAPNIPKPLLEGPQGGSVLVSVSVGSLKDVVIGLRLWQVTQILGTIYMLTQPSLVHLGMLFGVAHIVWRLYRRANFRMVSPR